MSFAALSIDLIAKLAQFEADMGKAARATERSAQQMAASIGIVKSGLQGLAGGITLGGIIAFGKATVDSLDALNDLSDATGASVENLSALEDIAARTGTNMEVVGSAVLKLNKAITDAQDPTSEAAKLFKALGLSVADLAKLDPAEALLKTASALSTFADGGTKGRAELELLGKTTRDLAPFLKDLAEAGRLNATVTKQQTEEAEKFNKELFNLQKNSQDASRALVSDLVTGINRAADALRKSGLLEGLRTLLTGDDRYKNNKALADQTAVLLNLEGALQTQRQAGFSDDSRVVKNTLAQIAGVKEQIRITQTYRQLLDQQDAAPPASPKPVLPEVGGKPLKATQQSDADRYLESLQKQLEKTQDLTVLEQLLQDIQQGRIKGATYAQKSELAALAINIDFANARAAAEKDQIKLQKEVSDMYERSTEAARRYITGLANENQQSAERNRQLSDTLEEMGLEAAALDRLNIARIDANIAQQEQALRDAEREKTGDAEIAQIERRIELLREQRALTQATATKRVAIEEAEANKQRTEALSRSIEDGILTGFRNGKGFADVFLDELKAQFAKTILRPIISPIAEAGSNLIGSFLKNFLSFDGGGYTGGGARAGGIDGKGGFLGVLHPQESIIDHTKGGRGGFSASTQIVVQGGMSKAETYAAISTALQERDRAWSEHLRAQGVLA